MQFDTGLSKQLTNEDTKLHIEYELCECKWNLTS